LRDWLSTGRVFGNEHDDVDSSLSNDNDQRRTWKSSEHVINYFKWNLNLENSNVGNHTENGFVGW